MWSVPQSQMLEDLADDAGPLDEGDDVQLTSTLGAGQSLDFVDLLDQSMTMVFPALSQATSLTSE